MLHKKHLPKILVSINLLVMGLVMVFAVKNDAPTSDEPPHILSGYVALKYGHNYIDSEHPLLVKAIAASPLLFQNIKVDLADPNYQFQENDLDIGKMFATSRKFMNYSGNNPDQILFSTRLVMILLTLAFGVGVYALAKKLFGETVGVLAVFLYSTEPNILANGSLFNTDMGAAGFVSLTLLALVYYGQSQTFKRLIFLTVVLTMALLTKFSAFYFIPVVLMFILYFNWKQKAQIVTHSSLLVFGGLSLICIFYGLISFRDQGLLGFIPRMYFQGLGMVFDSVSTDKRFSYLLGEAYFGSKAQYFPIMLAAKTQLLTLIGFTLSLLLIYLNKLSINHRNLLITLLPIGLYFILAIFSNFNIGVRHILPIYPILIIFAAAGFVALFRFLGKRFAWRNISIGLSVGMITIFSFRIWTIASTYPHFLSYYNITFGGTDNGWRVANDSNYDWGQDVKRLAEFVRSNNIKSLAFDNYTGLYAARDYYKLPVRSIHPGEKNFKGYVALSTSVITYYQNQTQNYSWIVDNYTPTRVGKSIFVYKLN